MHVVYPRPDTETQAHARHHWAYPGMTYEIPIGVQGGAWPFKYEIISGPSGATIGSVHNSQNYGIVNWVAPNSGTYTFKVRITDQDLNTIEAQWTVTVDPSMFVFIQDGWTGSKVGTIDQPLEDISDWYKGDQNDSTYHNKIIVFRGGNYQLLGDTGSNNNTRLLASTKTPSFIAYPGETPIIDCSISKVITGNASLKDIFVAGITWENGRQDVNNAHFWWAVGDVSRSTWWNNHFDNLSPGLTGNDNTSTVFISDNSKEKTNILYKDNLLTNIHNLGYNGSYVEAYFTSYMLIEGNVARDSDTNAGFFAKQTIAYVTIRANEAYQNVAGEQLGIGYGTPITPHDHEICWNRVVTTNASSGVTFMWAHSNANTSYYNSFIYRNTFVNGSSWVRFVGKENYKVDGNVVVSNMLSRWGTSIMDVVIPNITGNTSASITDTTGKLTGTYRFNFLGKRGYEISDSPITAIIPLAPTSITVN